MLDRLGAEPLERNNFAWLFCGILLLLVLAPILQQGGLASSAALEGAFTSLLLVGVWSLRSTRRWFFVAIGLAAANLVVLAIFLASANEFWLLCSTLTLLAFCVLCAILPIRFIISHRNIDLNHLMGALSVYLLLGVIWALLFVILRYFDPGALLNVSSPPGNPGEMRELLYYSYVTLTTLGYGDVTPASPLARNLSVLEAVFGQLFLAVMIASLVGRIRHAAD